MHDGQRVAVVVRTGAQDVRRQLSRQSRPVYIRAHCRAGEPPREFDKLRCGKDEEGWRVLGSWLQLFGECGGYQELSFQRRQRIQGRMAEKLLKAARGLYFEIFVVSADEALLKFTQKNQHKTRATFYTDTDIRTGRMG